MENIELNIGAIGAEITEQISKAVDKVRKANTGKEMVEAGDGLLTLFIAEMKTLEKLHDAGREIEKQNGAEYSTNFLMMLEGMEKLADYMKSTAQLVGLRYAEKSLEELGFIKDGGTEDEGD